jgi:protein tyrosine phosphatase (PTP) superfamily phosphohydrolase (DUF442 family)
VPNRRSLLALVAAATLAAAAPSQAADLKAPNVVTISPRLVTAGQPTEASLATLGAQGFRAVIYLAPPTVYDAIAREAEIVRGQGLEFVNIPIVFGQPTEADFEAFVQTMKRLGDDKVLVHCQVNMRASTFTFLYRAIVLREDPSQAFESVARVWSPSGPWKKLMLAQLKKAGIDFDPY